jgi:hypothetical protein
VRPTDDAQAAFDQGLGQHAGVGHHLLLVDLELGLQRFLEGHRLAGDHVHQRPALDAGEDGAVDLLGDVVVVRITTMPPRGPRRLLCVVEVTTSACGTGFG